MTSSTSYQTIVSYMPDNIKSSMAKVHSSEITRLSEVRLYNGRGIAFVFPDSVKFLKADGILSNLYNNSCVKISHLQLKTIINSLCHSSLHSHERELSEGYFVIENGVRVGVSGTYSQGISHILQSYSSLNFRIAREVKGCGTKVYEQTFGKSVIICGGVNSGKTTLLRDICRLYGNRFKCTLIDERNEISALNVGQPTNDIGLLTDVIGCRNRHESIISAVKTLSPKYIFCDEIADERDVEAIVSGVGSGVKFAATIHSSSFQELLKRKIMISLIEAGAFECAVMLKGSESPSEIMEIRSIENVC